MTSITCPTRYTWQRYPWPVDPDDFFNGFDGVLEDVRLSCRLLTTSVSPPTAPRLGRSTATYRPVYTDPISIGPVTPNLHTGSQIDIQLADDITGAAEDAIHFKSILRVMVYAPADGLVQEGTYLWSYQVHQVWAEPIPTTIVLTPSTDYAIAGGENQTVVAQVLDQFGDRCRYVDVSFRPSNGVLERRGLTNLAGDDLPVITDENGNAAVAWDQAPGDWGVEKVVAYLDYNLDGDL